MSHVLIEGLTVDEILALPPEDLRVLVLRDEPIVFRAGSAELLGRFFVVDDTLILELGHIEGGGEGALPALAFCYAGRPAIYRMAGARCALRKTKS